MKKALKQLITTVFLLLLSVSGQTTHAVANETTPVVTLDPVGLFGPNVEFRMSGKFKPETFYGNNTKLLNSKNQEDQVVYNSHSLDLKLDWIYGACTYGEPVAEFFFDLRNKAIWGNADSIATTGFATTKHLEVVDGEHKHSFPRHVLWMRQAWLEFNVGAATNIGLFDTHTFKLGAFPFELGRGIALGSAFAVGPEPLGFYTPDAVNQYAFGAKFGGYLVNNHVSYDLYAAILSNKSDNFSDTGEKVFGQAYGRLKTPERGFGNANYVLASRLKFDFESNNYGKAHVEPYVMYNNDPENKIEFTADAASKLTTLGLAAEFTNSCFEFGFDTAFNIGHQSVRGWDRNIIIHQNRGGISTLVNSKVVTDVVVGQDGMGMDIIEQVNVPYLPKGSAAQDIIDNALRSEGRNGEVIGKIPGQFNVINARPLVSSEMLANPNNHTHTVDLTLLPADDNGEVILKNAADRFRDPYKNTFKGWMFVTDASVKLWSDDFSVAGAFGIASGDDNPNTETKDFDYTGFVPLQESYEGKRVKSAFLLGSAGKVRRLLSRQGINQNQTKLGGVISSFTNLIHTGAGLTYKPQDSCRKFMFNSNVLTYWQEHQIVDFEKHLGTEVNIFTHFNLLADLKLFGVASVFIPGAHYDDIKDRLINAAAEEILDASDKTGFEKDQLPSFGNDVAFTFNVGLEYTF